MHFKKDKHYVYSFCAEFQYIVMLTYFYKNITNIKKNYYRYYTQSVLLQKSIITF